MVWFRFVIIVGISQMRREKSHGRLGKLTWIDSLIIPATDDRLN